MHYQLFKFRISPDKSSFQSCSGPRGANNYHNQTRDDKSLRFLNKLKDPMQTRPLSQIQNAHGKTDERDHSLQKATKIRMPVDKNLQHYLEPRTASDYRRRRCRSVCSSLRLHKERCVARRGNCKMKETLHWEVEARNSGKPQARTWVGAGAGSCHSQEGLGDLYTAIDAILKCSRVLWPPQFSLALLHPTEFYYCQKEVPRYSCI